MCFSQAETVLSQSGLKSFGERVYIYTKSVSMQKIVFISLLFLSLNLLVQTKITFRDSKQHVITGELIGSNLSYHLFESKKITQKTNFFLSELKGKYSLTEYKTWQTGDFVGRLDEMKIYKFAINQLDQNLQIREVTDDDEEVIGFSHSLNA